MTRKGRRLAIISIGIGFVALAAGLMLFAMRDNVVFFYTPAEVHAKSVEPGTRLRLGGLVKKGSIKKAEGQAVTFVITDNTREITVSYIGILPDLFREGQGVVSEGVLQSPTAFKAESVLAKHDENYMPRDLAESLKKQGLFKHAKGKFKTDKATGGPAQ